MGEPSYCRPAVSKNSPNIAFNNNPNIGLQAPTDGYDEPSDSSFIFIGELNEIELKNKAVDFARTLEQCALQLRWRAGAIERKKKAKRPRQARLPRFVTDYLLLLTAGWQVLCVTILVFIDVFARKSEKEVNAYYVAGIIIMFGFQLINLIVALAATVKLAKQYMHHTASTAFLIQSYLSTLVLFAGLYLLIYRMDPNSFDNVFDDKKRSKALVIELFMRMLFFSISTGSLCGGAPVVASVWYSEIVMSCQMMLSFIYFASVLSQFVNPSLTSTSDAEKKDTKKDLMLTNSYGSFTGQNEGLRQVDLGR